MFAAERNSRIARGSESVREKLPEANCSPTDGHTYLGDFVRRGGYADEANEAFSQLLEGDELCQMDVFNAQADQDRHKLLTRHRGMLLCIWSAFLERMYDPWMDEASFPGLVWTCETADSAEAGERARTFMSRRTCCAEALFVQRMQRRARANNAVSPELFLLSKEVKAPMRWASNTPPVLTISTMESTHAHFVNLLVSKGFARTGPLPILIDTLMTQWRNKLDSRLLLEIERLVAKALALLPENQHKQKKSKPNQYGQPRHMIGQIHAEVKRHTECLTRQRQVPQQTRPAKLGVRLFFEHFHLRNAKQADPSTWAFPKWNAFRQKTKDAWKALTPKGKAHWTQLRQATRGTRRSQLRPLKRRLETNRADTRAPSSSLFSIASSTRPIADEVLDRHPSTTYNKSSERLSEIKEPL